MDGDAEAKDMLKDDVRSECGGLVVVLQLLVASDLFVMGVAHMDVKCCWRVVRVCIAALLVVQMVLWDCAWFPLKSQIP